MGIALLRSEDLVSMITTGPCAFSASMPLSNPWSRRMPSLANKIKVFGAPYFARHRCNYSDWGEGSGDES